MKNSAIFAIAASMVIAAPAVAQSMSPSQYVAAAGASDLFERQSSQIVLQTTHDPKVRQFASMMVRDHGKSTAMVTAAARGAKVPVSPPQLMPQQAQMISQLQTATGPARDQLYLSQQRDAHQMALSLHQDYSANGSSARLKSAAAQIVPVVQHHIEMLQTM